MATGVNDLYANMGTTTVTLNGATIVFSELQTGISLGQGMGIIIDQFDYYFPFDNIDGLATGEQMIAAWTTSNSITSLSVTNRAVIHNSIMGRVDMGTAASGQILQQPNQHKFTPPIIVAAPRIYLACKGVSGQSNTISSRILFRYLKLTPQEYLELAETFILVG